MEYIVRAGERVGKDQIYKAIGRLAAGGRQLKVGGAGGQSRWLGLPGLPERGGTFGETCLEALQLHRLEQIVLYAQPDGTLGKGEIGVAADQHRDGAEAGALQLFQQGNAVHIRHADIRQDHIGLGF